MRQLLGHSRLVVNFPWFQKGVWSSGGQQLSEDLAHVGDAPAAAVAAATATVAPNT